MGLLVLGGVGAGIVFEKRDDEARVPLHIVGGPEYARRWIDSTASPSATAAMPGLWPPATVSTYRASAAASGASRAASTAIRCAGNTEEEIDGV
jgi:hypothetical protein